MSKNFGKHSYIKYSKKENRLLRTFIDQMKKEMQNRKVILDEELLRLKKLVVEALDNELMPFGTSTNVVTDKIITHRDLEVMKYQTTFIIYFVEYSVCRTSPSRTRI